MARKAESTSRTDAARRTPKEAPAQAKRTSPAPASAPSWPVWTAVALTAIYLVVHARKIPLSFELWEGIFRALFLGR